MYTICYKICEELINTLMCLLNNSFQIKSLGAFWGVFLPYSVVLINRCFGRYNNNNNNKLHVIIIIALYLLSVEQYIILMIIIIKTLQLISYYYVITIITIEKKGAGTHAH